MDWWHVSALREPGDLLNPNHTATFITGKGVQPQDQSLFNPLMTFLDLVVFASFLTVTPFNVHVRATIE